MSTKELDARELKQIAEVLEALERISENRHGLSRMNLGYALAELTDYDDESIYVSVEYGEEGSSYVHESLQFHREELGKKTAKQIALSMY